MGLKLIKDNGVVRKAWYGQYKEGGKWKVVKLTTPMHGSKIPESLSEEGDIPFERSRALAQAEFDRFEADRRVKGNAEGLTRTLIESKTGQKVEDIKVIDIERRWRIIHQRNRSKTWNKSISWMFALFTEAITCEYLYEVSTDMVVAFYEKIREEYAWSVTSRIMKLLKGAFDDLLPVGTSNPFARIEIAPDKDTEQTIHRKPLSDSELESLFEEAAKEPLLNNLTITAACTGMRIGDVCNLEWKSVDLKDKLIEVKTRKTGQEVTISIFPRLMQVLLDAQAKSDSRDKYVFPEAAEKYRTNYSGIIRMGKVLFAKALHQNDINETQLEIAESKTLTPEEVISKIHSAGFFKGKAEKVETVYRLYTSGLNYREITEQTGFSRGQISGYLHEVEDLTSNVIVKFAKERENSSRRLLKLTRQDRTVGKHSASLYGWHSLRASFVVQALANNIPVEIVRRVVGHSTIDMTLEYFNPTKRIMADTMRKKMQGSILSGDQVPQLEATPNLASLVANMTPAEREQLKALLG